MDSYKCPSDLNAFFQAMSKRINDEETNLKAGSTDNLVSILTEKIPQVMGFPLKLCIVGSITERLTCYLPGSNGFGDVDFMVIPYVEDSIIDESIMEYDTRKPVFVRLRGKDHPVLQHCLAENSDYVTTSTLKEFHPKVFGTQGSLILNLMRKGMANCNSIFPPSLGIIKDTYLLENPIGPALQFKLSIFSDVFRGTDVSFSTEESIAFINEHLTEIVAVVNNNKTKEEEDTDSNACSRHDVQDRIMSESIDTIMSCIFSSGENKDIGTSIKTKDGDNCSDSSNSPRSNEKENNAVVNKTKEDSEKNDSSACSRDEVQGRIVEQLECLGAAGGLNADKLTLTNEKVDVQDEELTDMESAFGDLFDVSEITNRKMNHQENQPIQSGFIDLVPAYEIKGWPEVAGAWTTRNRLWPSPDIISKILKSGYHLVVKSPKDSDRQDLDFRLSFSRAELILSGELNDIQRDCYRCFKMYYQSALQQREPKIITSYFFKTILLWTVEETGMEVWNEDNRGCCVMMLLEKLLKSLERKFLPHFFVPEFNLLEEAVVDYSQEVQELADEVKKIYENPMEYLLALIPPYQTNSDGTDLSEKKLESIEEPPAARKKLSLRDVVIRNPDLIEYQDFQNVYQDVCREPVDWVVQGNSTNEPEDLVMKSIIANMHSLEISKTEDEIMEFLEDEDISALVYQVSLLQSGRNPRQRIISALKETIENLLSCDTLLSFQAWLIRMYVKKAQSLVMPFVSEAQADLSQPHPLRDVMAILKALVKLKESTPELVRNRTDEDR